MSSKINNFYIVKNSISEDMSKLIYRYALFDEIKQGNVRDSQVPTAYSKYGDSLMESLLMFLQPTIEKKVNLSLYPTYAYYRIYRNGDFLKPHLDRPSCEISASICLGFNYKNYDWPLFINGNEIVLNPTDLAIYYGLESVHWRNKMDGPSDALQVQAFLHYVDANGPYSHYKYDTRPDIGFPVSSKTIH